MERPKRILYGATTTTTKSFCKYVDKLEEYVEYLERQVKTCNKPAVSGSLPSEIHVTYDESDGEVLCAFLDKEHYMPLRAFGEGITTKNTQREKEVIELLEELSEVKGDYLPTRLKLWAKQILC